MKKCLCFISVCFMLVATASAQNVTWTVVDSALHAFSCAGGGALGNYFYCFGDELENFGQAFNLNTEQWEASTPAPLGWRNWTGVATNDAVYLIGRNYGPYGNLYGNEVQKFTPIGGGPTGNWTQVANYPIETCGVAAAWDGGNYIYSAGGNPTPGVSAAYRYDIAADSWSPIANLPLDNRYAGGACVNGCFYVVGGVNADQMLYQYNPLTNTWTPRANIPTPVNFCNSSIVSNGELIFSVGGGSNYMAWTGTAAVQIYHPQTDSWTQETPMPAARGRNSVCFVPPDRVINAGGLTSVFAFSSTASTFRGVGFPGAGVVSNVHITLTPVNPPIQIPASGGTFDFNVEVSNDTSITQTFDAWIMVQLPNMSWYGPVLGPVNLTLPGGMTIDRDRIQDVPGNAPAGLYTYEGRVGNYPGMILNTSSFTFEKLIGGDGGWVSDWINGGDNFLMDEFAQNPEIFDLYGAHPNPFNPTTTISFTLPQAGFVKLGVFDVTGRNIGSPLIDGWREAGQHDVVFDGSNLPSGIYIYHLNAGEFTASGKMVLMK